MTDEVGVRFGMGGGVLFLLSGLIVAGGVPPAYGVGLLLAATLLLGARLDGPHALGLGLAAWAFATGFAVNTLGELTTAPSDLLRLAVFLLAAGLGRQLGRQLGGHRGGRPGERADGRPGRATRALRTTSGRAE